LSCCFPGQDYAIYKQDGTCVSEHKSLCLSETEFLTGNPDAADKDVTVNNDVGNEIAELLNGSERSGENGTIKEVVISEGVEQEECDYTIIVTPVKADVRKEPDEGLKDVIDVNIEKTGKGSANGEPFVVIHNQKWTFKHIDVAEKDGDGFKCKACKKWVSNISKYREHYSKVHHTKIGYRCVCKKFFSDEYAYNKHVDKFKDVHKQCTMCEEVFVSDIVLEEHIKAEHNPVKAVMKEEDKFGNFECEKCGVELQHLNLLMQHNENFPNCSELKKSDEDLQKELDEKEIMYTNEKGEKVVVQYGTLLKSQQLPPFTCEICNLKYGKRFSFARHLLSHLSEGTHSCPVCGIRVKGKEGLFKHMKKHLARLYKCEQCSTFFPSEMDLKAHETQGCQIQLQCDICDFVTPLA